MAIVTESNDLFFIDHVELLRFVQKKCLRMLESNTTQGHGVWIGLSLAALQRYPDLELRFQQLWVEEKEVQGEQRVRETSDILKSAIARIETINETDIGMAILDADEDPTEDLAILSESVPKMGRWLLFYLRQEAKQMLETEDYECVPMWEHLFRMSLTLVLSKGEFRDGPPCLDLAPEEKLRVGLDVIRDVLFRSAPKHNPWTLTDIECAS